MSKHSFRRSIAVVLAVTVGWGGVQLPVSALDYEGSRSLSFVKSDIVPNPRPSQESNRQKTKVYADWENVRVSIVLEDKSTIEAGYDIDTIAVDPIAIAYRDSLEQEQKDVQAAIEDEVLEGEELDVAWNLTLAANIISANVEYGQIDAIKDIDGVKDVVIETQYLPADVGVNETDPNMSTSSAMVGSTSVYNLGYTGAGSLVAIIDTGIDSAHQSFNDKAFEYSLSQLDKDVDLLTPAEVAAAAKKLNIYKNLKEADINKLYVSSKLPFAYNYVDRNFDITHENDIQGEHGSHVAGIAAANAYIPDGNGGFDKALTTVHTQGVAPDAQIITMKVFGTGGGANDSDYMAAIEDAIVLGADSINLSLGSAYPGEGFSDIYQNIMDSLVNNDSGAVVTMSAGNAGYWAEETANAYPYYDDINFDTVSTPASISTSLAVASVDNIGSTGIGFTVNDHYVIYTETEYTNDPLTTLAGERNYVYINSPGVHLDGSNDFDTLSSIIKGKVVLCNRGETNFAAKATAAAKAGAAALIVVNNAPGFINMDLTGYAETMPVVSITMAEGNFFREGESNQEGTLTYYTGTIDIGKDISVSSGVADPDNHYTMSDFSSWGIPGSLEMKPEITAPGGNIYSVNGSHLTEDTGVPAGGHDQYENMSGTSMAAPQVAGLTALITEYVEEEGLAEKYNINKRTLIQSLLMSTAKPVIETYEGENSAGETEGYYSILSQGAGLANAADAINSQAFILMSEDSVLNPDSAKDGKVKVELGDDPARIGKYSYSFTVTNISGSDVTYDLTTDMFTQDVYPDEILDTWTVPVEANVTYDCGKSVTVPAGGSAEVTVSIEITDKNVTNKLYYPNGAYIEGYTFLTPKNSSDGAKGVQLSIPILGFYGSWTDPAMYDNDSDFAESESQYDVAEGIPYFFADSSSEEGYSAYYSGMLYEDPEDGEEYYYIPNIYGWYLEKDYATALSRAAINGETLMKGYDVVQIRNGYAGVIVDVNGESNSIGTAKYSYSAYYSDEAATTIDPYHTFKIDTTAAEAGAKEGDTVQTSVVLIPEYYDLINADGSFDAAKLKKELGGGAFISSPKMIVDNTKPKMIDTELNADGSLTVTVSDNRYVGYVGVFSRSGAFLYAEGIPVQTSENSTSSITFDAAEIADAGQYALIMVADYAGNVQSYEIPLHEGEAIDYTGMYAYTEEVYASNAWIYVDPDTVGVTAQGINGVGLVDADSNHSIIAAAYADGYIFHATADNELYVSPIDAPGYDIAKVGNLPFTPVDMAFNPTDAQLYAVDDSNGIWTINPLNGECSYLYLLPGFAQLDEADADVNGDGKSDSKDAQAVLDYLAGNEETLANMKAGDLDGDGKLSTYDAYLILICVLGKYKVGALYTLQGLTIDKNGTFYASGYMSNYAPENPQGYLSDFIPNQNIFVWNEDDVNTVETVIDGEVYEISTVIQQNIGDGIDIGFNRGDNLTDAAGVLTYDPDSGLIYMAGDASDWLNVTVGGEPFPPENLDFLYVIDPVAKTWDYTNYDENDKPNSFLYAKFNSLLIVPESDFGNLEEAADQITGITLSPEELTLMEGGTADIEAILSPWTVPTDGVVIDWTSSDEDVATVKNGKVTAAGVGEAVITAAVNGTNVSATVDLTVIPMPAITLRGNVSSASGSAWSEFTTPDLSDSTTALAGNQSKIRAASPEIMGDYIYGHDGENIYRIDPETYEETPLYAMNPDYLFPDAAENLFFGVIGLGETTLVAPATGGDDLMLLLPESGGVYTDDGLGSEFGSPMAAIAYAGGDFEEFADYYYVLCENGTLGMIKITYDGYIYTGIVGKTGIDLKGVSDSTVDGDKFASLVYDSDNSTDENEQLILSYYTKGMDSAAISIINVDADGNVTVPGTAHFDSNVYPVTGLHFGPASEQSASASITARFDGSETTAKASEEAISCVADENSENVASPTSAPVSGVNSISTAYTLSSAPKNAAMPLDNGTGNAPTISNEDMEKAKNAIKISDVSVDTEKNEVTITVTAVEGSTNALFDIAYKNVLKLKDAKMLTTYSSCNTSDPEAVHLDFAFVTPLEVDTEVATLVFTYDELNEAGLDTNIYLKPFEVQTIISDDPDTPLAEIKAPVKIYSVTVNVENGTYTAPKSVGDGEELSVSFKPDSGYTAPQSVTVTVDGKVITEGYTYNSGKGELVIAADVIKGNVVIDAACVKLPVSIPTQPSTPDDGNVDVDVEIGGNGSSNAPTTTAQGKDLEFTLTPDAGYTLPDSIVITIDGVVLDPSQYTYDPETGKVTIPGDKVTGKVEVKAEFVAADQPGTAVPDDGNNNTDDDDVPPATGNALAILPVIISAGAVILFKKRRS